MVRLKTMDEVFFDPVPEVIFQSVLIKELVSDFGDHNDDTHIPLSNIHSEVLTKVIEFCERHRSDRPPLMKPYVPPPAAPPKPWYLMTAAEREAERLRGLGQGTVVTSATFPVVKLEQQAESENAVASGSGSGDSGDTNDNQQASTHGATETRADEVETVEVEATGTAATNGAISASGSHNALNGLEGAASEEASSKDGKEKDKAGAQPIEGEEEETPTMVPMTLVEVDRADDEWDKGFLQVDQDMLFSIILAANYLDIPSLLELGCKTIGAEVAGKTPAQVRERYRIPADYDVNDPPPSAPAEDDEQTEQEAQATDLKATRSKAAKRGKKRTK